MPSSAKLASLINTDEPVLVDFYASWCSPCKLLHPILKGVEKSFHHKLKILAIDVDKNPELASKFDVQGLPTLVLFKGGEILWRSSGVLPEDYLIQEIENKLNSRVKI